MTCVKFLNSRVVKIRCDSARKYASCSPKKRRLWMHPPVTRISFIFRDYDFNSHLQNYASKMQSDCKSVPETENIQDSSGRLIGEFAGVVGHDSKEEVLKCNENLVHF